MGRRKRLALWLLAACCCLAACLSQTGGMGPQVVLWTATPQPLPTPTPPTLAQVERIALSIHAETLPVQISVLVQGELPDTCSQLAPVVSGIDANSRWLWIQMTTERVAGKACFEEPHSFDQSLPLNIYGLPAGAYTVDVNGVSAGFVLEADNVAPVTAQTLQSTAGMRQEIVPEAEIAFLAPETWQKVEPLTWAAPDGAPPVHLQWTAINAEWNPDSLLPETGVVRNRQTPDLGWYGSILYLLQRTDRQQYEYHLVIPYENSTAYDFYAVAADEAQLQRVVEALLAIGRSVIVGYTARGSAEIQGMVWWDTCAVQTAGAVQTSPAMPAAGCVSDGADGYRADGRFQSDEGRVAGVKVILRAGQCPGEQDVAETTTDNEGKYSFAALASGIYCVTIDAHGEPNASQLQPGVWTYPAFDVGDATVLLRTPHAKINAYFGWDDQLD